jgi:16S rRNA (guanine527-N7)-methyltransferase
LHRTDLAILQSAIEQGAAELRCGLPEGGAEKLARYVELLAKWNSKINLTAIRDPAEMVTHHILDSLVVVPEFARFAFGGSQGQSVPQLPVRVADIGTGAGLPGIVLAVALPQLHVTCIDAVEKKISFVQQAIGTLGLTNARAIAVRVEQHREIYDIVTCRAFASLAEIVQLTGHLVAPGGCILAMKGPRLEAEAAALPTGWSFLGAVDLRVPGLEETRNLALLRRA